MDRTAPSLFRRWHRLPLLALLLACPPALAWSELGHRTVAALAEAALTEDARAAVAALLAGEPEPSLAGVAAWPDRIREQDAWKHTAPWHYLNFPEQAGCDYAPARDCPGGNCVVGAINRELAVLKDAARPLAERRAALKFLVHFVGDVHQPLHAGFAHDRGGNDFQVSLRLPGHDQPEGTNLHGVWDWWILSTREDDADAYTVLLGEQGLLTSERDAMRGNPAAGWAEESCRIVREPGFYPARHRLDMHYLDQWRPTAEKRMREAAGRLATLLNDALG
jgi:hypothetical protein